MSRHRNVRSMNYEDEYDGYDDVYGHSVEDDYCVSPSTESRYMFDRSANQSLSSYMKEDPISEGEEDAEEEDVLQTSSDFQRPRLASTEEARLNSCLEEIRNVIGDSTPDHVLIDAVMKSNYNFEMALNTVLEMQDAPKPQRQPRERKNRDYADLDPDPDPSLSGSEASLSGSEASNPTSQRSNHPNQDISHNQNTHQASHPPQAVKTISLKSPVDKKKTKSPTLLGHDDKENITANIQANTQEGKSELSGREIVIPKTDIIKHSGSQQADISTSLSEMVKEYSTSPQRKAGSMLSQLAQGHLSKPVKTTNPSEQKSNKPPSETGISLSELAQQHAKNPPTKTGISLSDIAAQHSTKASAGKSAPPTSDIAQRSSALKTGVNLSELAKQHASSPPSKPGVSLSELAKQHASSPPSKPGVSLSELAMQHNVSSSKPPITTPSVSLSDLAKHHQTGSPKPPVTTPGISLSDLAKQHDASPKPPGMSLSELAKQHQSQQSGTSTPKLVSSTGASPGAPGFNAASARMPQAAPSPRISLSDLARQHQQAATHPDPSSSVQPSTAASQASTGPKSNTPSHSKEPFIQGSQASGSSKNKSGISLTQLKSLNQDSNEASGKTTAQGSLGGISVPPGFNMPMQPHSASEGRTHRPPPGFKNPPMPTRMVNPAHQVDSVGGVLSSSPMSPGFLSRGSQSGGSMGLSSSPMSPGFLSRAPVDLSELAALHQQKHKSSPHRTPTTSECAPAPQPTPAVHQAQPSAFGLALCTHKNKTRRTKHASTPVTRKLATRDKPKQTKRSSKFSYSRQISTEPGAVEVVYTHIVPFDFSTPSPDDIVKNKQKSAFTRDGPRGKAGGESATPSGVGAPGQVAPPVVTQPAVVAPSGGKCQAPGQQKEGEQLPESVARLTFTTGSKTSSGFTPGKSGEAPAADQAEVNSVKADLSARLGGGGSGVTEGEGATAAETRLMPPPSVGPSSGTVTPTRGGSRSASPAPKSASKSKRDPMDIQKEYKQRQDNGKDYINLVVIGHVDAGKSTLMGHVLYQLGFVTKRTMHKYEQESKKFGKASFAFAWVLDETEEERSRGVTMDVAQTRFETPSKVVTLLDAPGHKDFIPNMITGAAQADVAVLVVNATKGEFETGFDAGGQTREHAMLIRSLGVSQLLVAVNKMDTVEWSEDRYKEIVKKLGQFLLKQAGFKETDISYIPCSGLSGENLAKPPTETKLSDWYSGPTLVHGIDQFKPPERPIDKPLRMCVTDVFKGMGAGISVTGTLQSGCVQPGDKILIMPQGETANVKSITIDDVPCQYAFAGDNTVLVLTGIDFTNVAVGSILCEPSSPIQSATRIQARVVVFNIDVPLTKGFPVVFHYQSLSEPAHIHRLVSQLHKSTGEVIKNKPRCLTKYSNAVIELEIGRPVCIELYKDFKDLGRFMLRYAGSTIAAGVVLQIKGTKAAKQGE